MTDLATLCVTAPATGSGIPITPAGAGGATDVWRLVVEAVTPGSAWGGWGFARWGVDVWSTRAWLDITDAVTGIEYLTGSPSPTDRWRTLTGTVTLDPAHELGAPFAPTLARVQPYLGIDTPIRAGLINDYTEEWLPLFTASIESVADPIEEDALGAPTQLTVRIVGPEADLAGSSTIAVAAVGASETITARVNRILTAAGWRWPACSLAYGAAQLEATTLAGNRLAELHLAADSEAGWFRTTATGVPVVEEFTSSSSLPAEIRLEDGQGVFMLGERSEAIPLVVTGPPTYTPVDTFLQVVPIASGRIFVSQLGPVAEVTFKRVGAGAVAQTATGGSRSPGVRVVSRTDLICTTDADALDAAEAELERRQAAGRQAHLELNANMDPELLRFLAQVAPGTGVPFWREYALDGLVLRLGVHQVAHQITPLVPGGVQWTTALDAVIWDQWNEGEADSTQNNYTPARPFPYDPA